MSTKFNSWASLLVAMEKKKKQNMMDGTAFLLWQIKHIILQDR